MARSTALLVLASLAGCASPVQRWCAEALALGPMRPTEAEAAAADYGHPPVNFEDTVQAAMSLLLKDPASARFGYGAPTKAWASVASIDSSRKLPSEARPDVGHVDRTKVFGWSVPFTVNAKNGFGAYTGPKPYAAFFRHGRLAALLEELEVNDSWGTPIQNTLLCWPETVSDIPRASPASVATPSR